MSEQEIENHCRDCPFPCTDGGRNCHRNYANDELTGDVGTWTDQNTTSTQPDKGERGIQTTPNIQQYLEGLHAQAEYEIETEGGDNQ